MSQRFRLAEGGTIDRDRELRFRFNGRQYTGHPGDTLASALLANGVHLVARSFKYHRPRGIFSAGVEEPNALVQVGTGARTLADLKATEVELFDGLEARSVNVFPSPGFDLGAGLGWLSRFTPAGFYYKTFFASPRLWRHVFEPAIRRAGGWGTAPAEADPDYYDKRHVHCEVLVVGGGPAGMMAARAAATGGARVILADENRAPGGSLCQRSGHADDAIGQWLGETVDTLDDRPEVRVLSRTAVCGYHDGNYLTALQRLGDEGRPSFPAAVRQRLWHVRARRVILATGAHERPLVFANNDRPGIMLAGAVRSYINAFAVAPGRRAVLFTNNDRAYHCALDCLDAGIEVAAVIDSRRQPAGTTVDAVRARGVRLLAGHAVANTRGRKRLRSVLATPLGGRAGDRAQRIDCDLLAVSGGYNPAVHLHSQAQGKLDFDPGLSCFCPGAARQAHVSVGAGAGCFDLDRALEQARDAGLEAAAACGWAADHSLALPEVATEAGAAPAPLWQVPAGKSKLRGRQFVDLQNDTSAADIELAVAEGFESVEHMKRYTLAGFGTDQGKTSNINALAILAELLGRPIPEVGTTTFRPPYTPLTLAALGGRHRGERFEPARETAIHDRHVAAGAVFEDVGQWKRPWYYPRDGEDMHAAVARECAATRQGAGVLDASTLGKIDVQGPDAAEFLNRVYTNAWKKLAVGRVRYGVMCGEDGMVFDDGTTARLDEQRYLMTTTTSGAARVLDHLEEYLQTEWPELRVRLTSVTEQWSTVSIAGPASGAVMATLAPDLDLSTEAFPFLSCQDAMVADMHARVFRISFTGELQYELNVPWHQGAVLWDAVMRAGEPHGITPYGTETMHVLRAEKGFIIVGQETDASQTPLDLGLDWIVSGKKDFIGRRSLRRSDMQRADREQLVGLTPAGTDRFVPEGSQLVEPGTAKHTPPVPLVGWVSSSYWSAALDHHFCLALVRGGRARHGDVVEAALPDGPVPLRIGPTVFYDPDNLRRDG